MSRSGSRRSLFGPIFLIGLGIVLLLASMHKLHASTFGIWFARYWPVLLIVWGVVRLIEFFAAKQSGVPAPRFGGGGVVLLIFIVLFGTAASAAHRNMRNIGDDFNVDGPWGDMFHGEPHDFDLPRKDVNFTGDHLTVDGDRADITVSASPDDQLHAMTHLTVFANSSDEADRIKQRITNDIALTQSGNVFTIGHGDEARAQIELQVPAAVVLSITNHRGDINVRDRKADVTIDAQRGEVTTENIHGNVTVRSGNRINFTSRQVQGDVSASGRFDDFTATDLSGIANLDGDFFGDIRLQKIGKGVHFHSSRTELNLGKVDGEFSMTSGDLQASSVAGPVRVITRAKDIHLQRISGDIDVENSNGSVELQPDAPLGTITVRNSRGSIEFVAPPNGSFVLEARSDRGGISSDLDLPVQTEHDNSSAEATIGKGGNKVTLTAEGGSINLRKQ